MDRSMRLARSITSRTCLTTSGPSAVLPVRNGGTGAAEVGSRVGFRRRLRFVFRLGFDLRLVAGRLLARTRRGRCWGRWQIGDGLERWGFGRRQRLDHARRRRRDGERRADLWRLRLCARTCARGGRQSLSAAAGLASSGVRRSRDHGPGRPPRAGLFRLSLAVVRRAHRLTPGARRRERASSLATCGTPRSGSAASDR